MLCVVCSETAVVWCHNDEAALCEACDKTVHSSGPLAWKHKRSHICPDGSYRDCSKSCDHHMTDLSPSTDHAAIHVQPMMMESSAVRYKIIAVFSSCTLVEIGLQNFRESRGICSPCRSDIQT